MSYVPRYIMKRIVPMDALANYDTTGDGRPDHVGLTYVNLLAPLEIPQDLDPDDLISQLKEVAIDDAPLDREAVLAGQVWYEGEKFTLENLAAAAGRTVPIGGRLLILLPYPGGLPEGKHKVRLVTEYQGQQSVTEFEREVSADRLCLEAPK
ncbi:MAG: hypothetical protein Kow0069_17330 [Promethearchaeota archaeon]